MDYIEENISIHDLYTSGNIEVKNNYGLFQPISIDYNSNAFEVGGQYIDVQQGLEAGMFRLKWLDEIDIAQLNFSRAKEFKDFIVMIHNQDHTLQLGFRPKSGAVSIKTVTTQKKVTEHYTGIPKTKGHLLIILESLPPCHKLSLSL